MASLNGLDITTARRHMVCFAICRKDSRLPEQLQRAMAAEAEAAREARAKIIRAHGEEKATRALKQAADELTHNPNAMQLRYLQVSKNFNYISNQFNDIFFQKSL